MYLSIHLLIQLFNKHCQRASSVLSAEFTKENTTGPTSTSMSTSAGLERAHVSGGALLVDTLEGAGLQAAGSP